MPDAISSEVQAVYLDHAATTPTDPRVVEAMLPYFSDDYGNPSSAHRFGRTADKALQSARRTLARQINASPRDLIFTSGGSESDNLALRGVIMAAIQRCERPYLLTSRAEHHAVSQTAQQLACTSACNVQFLPVDAYGAINPDTLRQALIAIRRDDAHSPILVSLMLANNEVGTLQSIAALAAIAHEYGAQFHSDAAQAAGQLPVDVQALGVDLLTLAAHKCYGPKGVGLLYVREGVELLPTQSGGGQEQDRRAGTSNVPLIVGMVTAFDLAGQNLEAHTANYQARRDQIVSGVLFRIPDAQLTGHPTIRLPNHASFVIEGVESNTLLMHLDTRGVAASAGSACNTGSPAPSDVLLAMGYPPDLALGSLRLTVGRQTTAAAVDYALDVLVESVGRLRSVNARQHRIASR